MHYVILVASYDAGRLVRRAIRIANGWKFFPSATEVITSRAERVSSFKRQLK